MKQRANGRPACSWIIDREHYRDIECGKPALLAVDRKRGLAQLLICVSHMEDRAVYAEVMANGLRWYLLADPDDYVDKETPPV